MMVVIHNVEQVPLRVLQLTEKHEQQVNIIAKFELFLLKSTLNEPIKLLYLAIVIQVILKANIFCVGFVWVLFCFQNNKTSCSQKYEDES